MVILIWVFDREELLFDRGSVRIFLMCCFCQCGVGILNVCGFFGWFKGSDLGVFLGEKVQNKKTEYFLVSFKTNRLSPPRKAVAPSAVFTHPGTPKNPGKIYILPPILPGNPLILL